MKTSQDNNTLNTIAISDPLTAIDSSTTPDEFPHQSSSLYDENVISVEQQIPQNSSNTNADASDDDITDQNTVSARVGVQGHWGVDEDTG